MTRLLDCFSSLVSFGLSVDSGPGSVPEQRERALRLIETARDQAAAAGYPAATVESAVHFGCSASGSD